MKMIQDRNNDQVYVLLGSM